MKRALLSIGIACLLVVSASSVASAGEVKGPPGPDGAEGGTTPIDGFWTGDGAASICSFSGLNDEISADEPTQTQSFGTFMVLVKRTFDLSPADAKAFLGETPADSCNPNHAPFGNPKKP